LVVNHIHTYHNIILRLLNWLNIYALCKFNLQKNTPYLFENNSVNLADDILVTVVRYVELSIQ